MKKVYAIAACLMLLAVSLVTAQQPAPGARDLYTTYEQTGGGGGGQGHAQPHRPGKPGTKVTIELNRGGRISWVSPHSIFRSGDKIRFHFKTNFRGYIAVINEGTTGRQNLLFPYPGVSNEVAPTADYVIPKNNSWIVFDDNEGTEQVVFIMSKNRIPELQQLMTSAPAGGAASSGGGTAPASTGGAAGASEEQEILAALNSRAMGRTRDLTLEVQGSDAYVVTAAPNLSKPIGFRLSLKHRRG